MREHQLPSLPSTEEVGVQARRAVRKSAPWVEGLGRLGHAAHGAVYAVVGLLAAQAAVGAGGATTDVETLLAWTVNAPLGRVLLIIMAVGLFCYALWRFIQAGRDTEGKGTSPRGLLARAGFAGSGLVHLSLALSMLQFSFSLRGGPERDSAQDWTTRLLALPFGQPGLVIAGLVILGVAVAQARLAFQARLDDGGQCEPIHPTLECWLDRLGRVGYAARCVVFTIIGGFLIMAAVNQDPGQARGLGGALATIAVQPFGSWLLLTVAVGVMAFGFFELAEAYVRRMNMTR